MISRGDTSIGEQVKLVCFSNPTLASFSSVSFHQLDAEQNQQQYQQQKTHKITKIMFDFFFLSIERIVICLESEQWNLDDVPCDGNKVQKIDLPRRWQMRERRKRDRERKRDVNRLWKMLKSCWITFYVCVWCVKQADNLEPMTFSFWRGENNEAHANIDKKWWVHSPLIGVKVHFTYNSLDTYRHANDIWANKSI